MIIVRKRSPLPHSPPSPLLVRGLGGVAMSSKGASLHFMRMFAVFWADGYFRLPSKDQESDFPCRSLTERVKMLAMLNEGLDAIKQKRQTFIQSDIVSDLLLAALVLYSLYTRYKYDFTRRARVRQLLALWSGQRSESAFNQVFSSRPHFLQLPSGEWFSDFDRELSKAHADACHRNEWAGMSKKQQLVCLTRQKWQGLFHPDRKPKKQVKTKMSYLAYYLEKRALVCCLDDGNNEISADSLVALPKMWPFPLSAKRLMEEGGGDMLIVPLAIAPSPLFIFH